MLLQFLLENKKHPQWHCKVISFLSWVFWPFSQILSFMVIVFSEATEISISWKGRQFCSPSLRVSSPSPQSGYFGLMLALGWHILGKKRNNRGGLPDPTKTKTCQDHGQDHGREDPYGPWLTLCFGYLLTLWSGKTSSLWTSMFPFSNGGNGGICFSGLFWELTEFIYRLCGHNN